MPTSLGRLNGQKDGQTESVKQHRALHAVVRQKGITNESINHIFFAKNKIRYSCMYNYKYGRLSEKLWSSSSCSSIVTSCAGGRHNTPPPPASWPLTLKVVSESRVTWSTSVPILFFLGLSVLDLGPMYATDRRQTSDAHRRLMPLPSGREYNNMNAYCTKWDNNANHIHAAHRRLSTLTVSSCLTLSCSSDVGLENGSPALAHQCYILEVLVFEDRSCTRPINDNHRLLGLD